jgi:hypothetical protein
MFIQGNIDKNMKLSAEDILKISRFWLIIMKLKMRKYQKLSKLEIGLGDLINNIKKSLQDKQ